MFTVYLTPASSEIQTILDAWSSTLPLDEMTGESIITESDLNRLTTILSRYVVHTIASTRTSQISQT
jgi:hypothetical protein